jgi:voltage-gated potassium channel Kch
LRRKQYAVIGIGRFGESIVRELVRMGHEVLAIDTDEDKIQDIADVATQAVQADAMDEKVLKALDITSFDAVIVAVGEDLEASILTSLTLKNLGVKKTIAKAQSDMHGKVLEKIGVDIVVHPERDMGIRLARTLVRYEDIGRHNAVDKVIGHAFLRQIPLHDKCLFLSGRIASEILYKVARAGFPMIVSRSAPTFKAVEQAEQLGITVVGFARGPRFNLYCHEHRVARQ